MEKILFLNVAWMKNYKGITQDDRPVGGGSFVASHKFGHEIFNFKPYKGYCYGYAQPRGDTIDIKRIEMNIKRIGAGKEDEYVDNVFAVWVSQSHIIGWYKNATVFRKHQRAPAGSERFYKNTEIGYFVKAKAENCTLLPIDERTFLIPRRKKGWMGQANVWYAGQPENSKFREQVLDFIKEGKNPRIDINKQSLKGGAWQPDPLKRQKIEKIAIEKVIEYYKKAGYIVDSREKDNLGWDLEASFDDRTLKLEVKGLSGKEVSIDFTPREYEKMKELKEDYRICVVTDTLIKPLLRIFCFSPDSGKWEDDESNQLNIEEIISARMNL